MNLSGVRQVNVVENPNAEANQYGDPPYSVHIYVLGGKEQNIAQCLVDNVAAGITMAGTKQITAQDNTGTPQTVSFDFAKDKPIYATVQIRTNEEWNADEGVQDVKQAIADYVNNLLMGQEVYLTKIYPSIYSIPGIGEAKVQIGTNPNHLYDKDIATEPFEAVSCNTDNIQVNVDGI